MQKVTVSLTGTKQVPMHKTLRRKAKKVPKTFDEFLDMVDIKDYSDVVFNLQIYGKLNMPSDFAVNLTNRKGLTIKQFLAKKNLEAIFNAKTNMNLVEYRNRIYLVEDKAITSVKYEYPDVGEGYIIPTKNVPKDSIIFIRLS